MSDMVSDLEIILEKLGWTIEQSPYPEIAERHEAQLGKWSVIKGPVRIMADDAAEIVRRVKAVEERVIEAEPPIEPTPTALPQELLGPIAIGYGDVVSSIPPPKRRPRRRIELPMVDTEQWDRPKTRGDCIDGPRPCPWVGCRFHLLIDVKSKGSIVVNSSDGPKTLGPRRTFDEDWSDDAVAKLETMKHTCALDIADRGEHTLEEVGEIYGLTRERIRQISDFGVAKLRRKASKNLS